MEKSRAKNIARAFLTTACALCIVAAVCTSASAFSLLGNYSKYNPIKWTDEIAPFFEDGLTYTIEDGFLGGNAAAAEAVKDAFLAWSLAGSDLYYVPSPGLSIPATDTLINQLGLNQALWNWQFNHVPVTVPIEGDAGLGANVDVFSRPSNFSFVLGGQTIGFSSGTLALTVCKYQSTQMVSADIYFNEKWSWKTDGSVYYDVATVAVHEIGHTVGLGHPNTAPSGFNYNPVTYVAETYIHKNSDSVMYSIYDGVKRTLRLEDTGGAKFLYGLPEPKSGALIKSFDCFGISYSLQSTANDAGIIDMLNPLAPHYGLFNALIQDGVQGVNGNAGFMFAGANPSWVYTSLFPFYSTMSIEFDIMLLSGPIIDPGAYFSIAIGGVEFYRLDYDNLPDELEFFAFEGEEGVQLRTNYYHVSLDFEDMPSTLLNRWYNGVFEFGTDGGLAGGGYSLDSLEGLEGQVVPEPATAAMILLAAFSLAACARKKNVIHHGDTENTEKKEP